MNRNIAKSRLLDLYKITIADGNIDKKEYHFLIDIAKIIGLTVDDALDILNGEINFEIEKPKSINDRMQHLFQMLFLMKIDGNIDKSEVETIKNISLHLGLNLLMTNELIETIRKYKKGQVPQEEMIRIVKMHMN